MNRRYVIFSFYLIFSLFFFPSQVFAQNIPIPTVQSIDPTITNLKAEGLGSQLEDFAQSIKAISEKLREMYKRSVPLETGDRFDNEIQANINPRGIIPTQAVNIIPTQIIQAIPTDVQLEINKSDSAVNAAKGYDLKVAGSTDKITEPETLSWLEQIWMQTRDLVAGFIQVGNERAGQTVYKELPLDNINISTSSNQDNTSSSLSIDNISNVLGVQAIRSDAMKKSVGIVECMNLPIRLGDCGGDNIADVPIDSSKVR